MNIYEHHEVLGWFFLPEDPDNRVPGVLKWDPAKGAEIELMGGLCTGLSDKDVPADQMRRFTSLEGMSNADFGIITLAEEISSIPVIFLETKEGKKYSIWDAQRGNYSVSLSSVRTKEEHWHSMQVYVDDHILPEEKIFTKATFYIDELYYLVNEYQIWQPKWCPMEEVGRPGEKPENGTSLMPYMLLVTGGFRPGIFEGSTEDAHYSINLSMTRPWGREATEDTPWLNLNSIVKRQRHGLTLTISAEASVSIIFRKNTEEPKDLVGTASDLIDKFVPIYDLMRLATFQPCGVASIQLQQHDNEHGSLLVNLGEVARPNEHHEQLDVVFTLNDISLENFLKERERLTSKDGAFDPWVILIGLCGYIPNYMEEYISQSFAAAEGFHKLCLDKDERTCLKDRLEDLYSLLPQKIRNQIKFDDDLKIWAELAANVRHRAAHAGPQDEQDKNTISNVRKRYVGTLSISDRNAVAVSAHLVTYLVLLNELGVSSEAICNALNMHPKISTMVYYCSKVRPLLESIKNLPTS